MRRVIPVVFLTMALALAGCGGSTPSQSPVIDDFSPDDPCYLFKGVGASYGGLVTFHVTASDPEGDPLTYSWTVDTSSVGTNSPSYDWTPPAVPALPTTVTIAVEISDGTNEITKTWSVRIVDSQIHYDTGQDNGIASTNMTMAGAIHLTPAKLAPFVGLQIDRIYVYSEYADTQATGSIRTNDANLPGTSLASTGAQAVTVGWNTLTLDTPIAITGASDLWVVCSLTATGNVGLGMQTCTGTEDPDADWINLGGGWQHYHDVFGEESYAIVCLRAYVALGGE